jgi:hypothetical protein
MDLLEEVDGGFALGRALVDLGADGPPVRDDLAELAVERDLVAAVGDHHVAPGAADPRPAESLTPPTTSP